VTTAASAQVSTLCFHRVIPGIKLSHKTHTHTHTYTYISQQICTRIM
jgi:hypothetical protein